MICHQLPNVMETSSFLQGGDMIKVTGGQWGCHFSFCLVACPLHTLDLYISSFSFFKVHRKNDTVVFESTLESDRSGIEILARCLLCWLEQVSFFLALFPHLLIGAMKNKWDYNYKALSLVFDYRVSDSTQKKAISIFCILSLYWSF